MASTRARHGPEQALFVKRKGDLSTQEENHANDHKNLQNALNAQQTYLYLSFLLST